MDSRNEAHPVPTQTDVTFPNIAGTWATGMGWSSAQQQINIFPPVGVYVAPADPPRELAPLDWLRDQVDEVCAIGRAA